MPGATSPSTADQPGLPPWLIELPTCPSTNAWALAHAEALAHGAVVWTRRQTAGRGQYGRSWQSPPGVLTTSIVCALTTAVPPGHLALATGLAVAHAVEDLVPAARVALKWPNDCYLLDRKLGGILCEAADARTVVVGIGLNVDPVWDADALRRAGLETEPIALADVQRPIPEMPTLLAAIRRYLLEGCGLLAAAGLSPLLPALRARDWLRGRPLRAAVGGATIDGVGAGIGEDGALRIDTPDGGRAIASGSVRAIGDTPRP